MQENSVQGSVIINADIQTIWEVLTNPDKIALYTGARVQSDWGVGSPVTWSGELFGTTYENNGRILENLPHQQLTFTYWSGLGGDMDLPENYSTVSYTLRQMDDASIELTYHRINIPTEMETQIFRENLASILGNIKKLAEEQEQDQ